MWLKVRALAESKILTRASYSMLVLVPILAALWPSVRAGVNEYGRSAVLSSEKLAVAASALRVEATRLSEVVASIPENEPRSAEVSGVVVELVQLLDTLTAKFSEVQREYSEVALRSRGLLATRGESELGSPRRDRLGRSARSFHYDAENISGEGSNEGGPLFCSVEVVEDSVKDKRYGESQESEDENE